MNTRCRLVVLGVAVGLAITSGRAASGQAQSSGQQKCINTLNKDTCKVAAAQGKENSGCVKAGTKGTASAGCLTADSKNKVGKKKSKTTGDEGANGCLGANAPDFGYTSAATGNAVADDGEVALFSDIYGTTDPSAVISTASPAGGCQSAVTKDLEKLIAAKWKAYVACKKTALKVGASSVAALENCVTPGGIALDAKGRIGKARTKLDGDITSSCTGVTVGTTFPGRCSGASLGGLGACLDRAAECRICLALNATDGMGVDCDLFDDGAANGSCGDVVHKCVLTGSSAISLYNAAFLVPLTFSTTGSSIDIGGIGNGATCDVQSFPPINIVSIGFLCVSPASGCPAGTRYCGPGAPGSGPALGIDVESDGNIGACSANTTCSTACDAVCPTYGAGFVQQSSGCTGYCTGTTPADSPCTTDAQCGGAGNGACNGPDSPGPHANICQCTCIKSDAFGGSDPGDAQCNLGAMLRVEEAMPCGGTDILIDIGKACIPLTTQRAKGLIVDANFIPGSTVPNPPPNPQNDQAGTPLACTTLDASTTTGLTAVGATNFFGSTIGDLSVGVTTACQ